MKLQLLSINTTNLKKITVSLVGNKVMAGFPSPADNFLEREIDLNEYMLQNKEATFLARVGGNSMQVCGIYENDIVVVDKSQTPKHNDVVIAVLNGEFTMKRFVKKQGKVLLVPENEDYATVEVSECNNFRVWGVVKFAIKHL